MSEIDYKSTKIHYPRTNNESVLEFIYPRDPNLFLRKNKIAIRGFVEVPEKYIPDNGFAAKVKRTYMNIYTSLVVFVANG